MAEINKNQITIFIKRYWQEFVLFVSTLIYIIFFTTASFLKYVNYYTGRFDLGNMDQTVWNTLHGNLFMLTDPNGTREVSRLAFHADFILALLAPLYLIWEDPRMLLLFQTLILSLGGIFIYLIAKNLLKNKTISLVFALCFFLNPAVGYVNLYDFHAVALATTFFLAAFYFTLIKKWWAVILFLFLAGITKEQVWAINALFGLYIFFVSRQKALGLFITAFSAFIFYFLFWVAIPKAAGDGHFALEFYSDYGDSPGQIMKNLIVNPISTIQTLFLSDRIDYIRKLFMPLGYFSFLAFPLLIFAGPDLAIGLLSNSPQMHQIYYQYSATITPFIFIAAIYAVKLIIKKIPEIPLSAISTVLLILTLVSAYDYGPLPFARKPNNAWYKAPLENRQIIDSYLNRIPDDVVISASNSLGSHLSQRKQIFVVPSGIEESDLVLILYRNPTKREENIFNEMKNNPKFELIFNDGNFYVFKRLGLLDRTSYKFLLN